MSYCIRLPADLDPQLALPKLRLLEEEEPQLRMVWDARLREIRVQLMGAVQLEILQSLIRMRFGWDVTFDTGRISYRETTPRPSKASAILSRCGIMPSPPDPRSPAAGQRSRVRHRLQRGRAGPELAAPHSDASAGKAAPRCADPAPLSRTCASRWPPGAPI